MLRLASQFTILITLIFLLFITSWVTAADVLLAERWHHVIYFEKSGDTVIMMILDTRTGKKTTFCCERPFLGRDLYMPSGPAWSPNGEQLAFNAFEHGHKRLIIYNFHTQKVRVYEGREPYWSPDGKKLAYKRPNLVMILNPDTGRTQSVRVAIAPSSRLQWSPDSTRIAFVGTVGSKPHLIDVQTGQVELLIDRAVTTTPVWSRDGQWLALFAGNMEGIRLIVLDPVSNMVIETKGGFRRTSSPVWTNDGQLLVIGTHPIYQTRAIYRYDPDTNQITQVTDSMAYQMDIVMQEGNALLIRRFVGEGYFNTYLMSNNILHPLPVPLYKQSVPGYDLVFR